MKTVIFGSVTPDVLERADFLAGIVPTSFITNGVTASSAECGLPVDVIRLEPLIKDDDMAQRQSNWRMSIRAEAAIIIGRNDHLYRCLQKFGVPIHCES